MATKTYVSKDKLSFYDKKLKAKIATDTSNILTDAKSYTDTELEGFATEVNQAVDIIVDELELINNKMENDLSSDKTLSIDGAFADAKITGDAIAQKTQIQLITWEVGD